MAHMHTAREGVRRAVRGLALAMLSVLGSFEATGDANAKASDAQTVLGPGLYAFQTRTRDSSCGDAEQDGYVLSYFAAIDGVPGSRSMTMELVNTDYFKTWKLRVEGSDTIKGDSKVAGKGGAENHFEIKRDKNRFTGTGSRSYDAKVAGKLTRCRVNYDALLKRVDSL